MTYLLFHTADWSPGPLTGALAAAGVRIERLDDPRSCPAAECPAVMVLGAGSLESTPAAAIAELWSRGVVPLAIARDAADPAPGGGNAAVERLSAWLPADASRDRVLVAIRSALRESALRRNAARAEHLLADREAEVRELTEIGSELTLEKDYPTLLETILRYARRATRSDAGSLYLSEAAPDNQRRLRFALIQNDSRPDLVSMDDTLPLDHTSLAGHVALTREPLVIDDAYRLGDDFPADFNPGFDRDHGYHTKSLLVLPLVDHQGQIMGVIQLINCKRDANAILETPDDFDRCVIGYSSREVNLARSLSSQAAVALENGLLYQAIERLFDGFVRAAVTAVERRDPITSGHSERVADMAVRLAGIVSEQRTGRYRDTKLGPNALRELRYAALLHDFGKVGVPETILGKAKKLHSFELEMIRQRHAFLVRTAQWQFEKARANHLEAYGREGYDQLLPALRSAEAQEFSRLDGLLTAVMEANEPSVTSEGVGDRLDEFAAETYRTLDGRAEPLLSDEEIRHLSIPQGTLDEDERRVLEDHVRHTFEFLRRIPWTSELARVPDIAYGHHERLDGTGYPRGLRAPEIALQTRMMTLADIFDALTALNRPYKPALPAARALDVMRAEVLGGGLDPDLFDLFVHARVYEQGAGIA